MEILEGVHVCLEQKATEIQFKFIKYFYFNLLLRVFFFPLGNQMNLGKRCGQFRVSDLTDPKNNLD